MSTRYAPPDENDTRPYAVSSKLPPEGKDIELRKDPSSETGYSVYFTDPPVPEVDQDALRDAQIKALSERNDFLEECLVEMAQIVYNF